MSRSESTLPNNSSGVQNRSENFRYERTSKQRRDTNKIEITNESMVKKYFEIKEFAQV